MAIPKIVRVEVEAITADAEAGLDRTSDALDRTGAAAQRAGTRSKTATASMAKMGSKMSGSTRQVQNAAFQLQDFAVQVQSGTSASVALAQQLPQLLGGFGALGAVLGVVAAVAIPVATAMRGMAQNGQDVTAVFGTLQPLAASLVTAFGAVKEAVVSSAELIVNNIDRIIITAGVAATLFAGKFAAGFIAARVATFSLAGAMTFLRGAIIRTGIGALIVGAGEMVYQFTRLAKATGGVGGAIDLLKDVAAETFTKIKAYADVMAANLGIVMNDIHHAWATMTGNMLVQWGHFVDRVASTGLGGMLGLEGGNADAAMAAMASNLTGITDGLSGLYEKLGAAQETINAPMESVQKLRDLLAGMKDEGLTLDSIFGLGGDDEDGKGGANDKLKEQLDERQSMIQEYMDRYKAISSASLTTAAGAWSNYFQSVGQAAGKHGSAMLKAAQATGAAQALVNSWVAYTAELRNEHSDVASRLAAAGAVLAAGLGAVSTIKGVSSSGSSSSSSSSGSSSSSSSSAAASSSTSPLDVRLSGLDSSSLYSGSTLSAMFDALSEEAGDRGLRFVSA